MVGKHFYVVMQHTTENRRKKQHIQRIFTFKRSLFTLNARDLYRTRCILIFQIAIFCTSKKSYFMQRIPNVTKLETFFSLSLVAPVAHTQQEREKGRKNCQITTRNSYSQIITHWLVVFICLFGLCLLLPVWGAHIFRCAAPSPQL